MKNIYLAIICALFIQASVYSQSCLPEGIFFETQEQIDNFQTDFPGCTEIEGEVVIRGYEGNITNLNGLSVLTSIGGLLSIESTAGTSLSGLENLTTIGGDLRIGIAFNGWGEPNPNLNDISALENLTLIGGALRIGFNESLSICEIQSICDYLASPNGYIEILENAPGCNSQEEIEDACEAVNVNEIKFKNQIFIYPNPATNEIFIENNISVKITNVNIYNNIGQVVLQEKLLSDKIDITTLNRGLYFIELVSNEMRIRKKLIVN